MAEAELGLWRQKWMREAEDGREVPTTAAGALDTCDREIFPLIHTFLQILATLPRRDEKKAGGHLLKGRNFDDPGSSGSTTQTRQQRRRLHNEQVVDLGSADEATSPGDKAIARSWYRCVIQTGKRNLSWKNQ
ncbi:hypothetical protein HPB52_024483 [Rhipicephalus sanguineus]|uniref:Uncharacterized protein n=1 Tax=Rhipicephalus sanguineus TaxID=34632 RepID=A0A9D4TC86_RHISA|nr:hypothetical protein HPB52_024483 [Rhipicephalus sanguineus]